MSMILTIVEGDLRANGDDGLTDEERDAKQIKFEAALLGRKLTPDEIQTFIDVMSIINAKIRGEP